MIDVLHEIADIASQIITVLTPLALAFITIWLPIKLRRTENRLTEKVEEAKEAVTNNHDTHLRVDLDSKFEDLDSKINLALGKLSRIFQLHGKLSKVVIAQRNDIAQLFQMSAEESDSGEFVLEDTITRELRDELIRPEPSAEDAPEP